MATFRGTKRRERMPNLLLLDPMLKKTQISNSTNVSRSQNSALEPQRESSGDTVARFKIPHPILDTRLNPGLVSVALPQFR